MEVSFLAEIQDFNVQYLILAQKMLHVDLEVSMFRLGIKKDIALLLLSMTSKQIVKLAAQDRVLCQFCIDEKSIIDLLLSVSRARNEVFSHAKILMAKKNFENSDK